FALRLLHSLPTRRSSDLLLFQPSALSGLVRALVGAWPRLLFVGDGAAACLWHRASAEGHAGRATNGNRRRTATAFGSDPPGNRADRKSTRLNSSHVKNSY